MSQFLKIFFILCGFVAAFLLGRNYGEGTVTESKEYLALKSKADANIQAEEQIQNLKGKIQNLIDSSDLKKADEVYGKIMTLFLAELGLHLTEEQKSQYEEGKNRAVRCEQPKKEALALMNKEQTKDIQKNETTLIEKKKNSAKIKTNEWMLENATRDEELVKRLEGVKINSLDEFLNNSKEQPLIEAEKFYGKYRGRIINMNNKDGGLLIVELAKTTKDGSDVVGGQIQIVRNNKVESNSRFRSSSLGFSPNGSNAVIIEIGPRHMQLYAVPGLQKLAGHIYERLPNGTTNLEGTFVLSRVDQF